LVNQDFIGKSLRIFCRRGYQDLQIIEAKIASSKAWWQCKKSPRRKKENGTQLDAVFFCNFLSTLIQVAAMVAPLAAARAAGKAHRPRQDNSAAADTSCLLAELVD
jgi:hypothetical protein